ncbi:MAG: membrane dipeptidase [Chloroflexi bacterium]|nr:membrane dipeptidase [Chloroflexota bacterium]
MNILVDAHQDLAWNIQNFGRDYTRAANETRALEIGSPAVAQNGDTLLGWPDYQRGRVAVIFSTLFAAPTRRRLGEWERVVYPDDDFAAARKLYWTQLETYHRLADSHPDKFTLLASRADLERTLDLWLSPADARPVGLLPLMEGAEGIRAPSDLAAWWDFGLRVIGLAWTGTRYCGGTREPGPLTDEGRALLKAMSDFPFLLDLSHMDEPAALESLDRYGGPVIATHGNCLALLPGVDTNRQFSDRVIRGVIQRGGVVGVVPFNVFLKVGWSLASGSRREEVSLSVLADHIDHICQLAGNVHHAGIGSDFDGGFGLQSVPHEIDTIADLHKLADHLQPRGYSEADIEAILGGNWIRCLRESLPT